MSGWRRAVLMGAAALLAFPAGATQLAVLAPKDITAPAPLLSAETLSPQADAVRRILDQAEAAGSEADRLAGIRRAYAARGYEPLWIADGRPSPQMRGLMRRMEAAGALGLDPQAYAGMDLESIPDDPALRAAADVEFSRTVARFVTHLASGRLRPAEVSRLITLTPERPDVGEALLQLSRTAGVALALSRYEPQHPQYRALKAKLAELRRQSSKPAAAPIPPGAALKPGATDLRVPMLRARLGVQAADGKGETYDAALVEAVKAFQSAQGLAADGVLGPRTLTALNGVSVEADLAAIAANLERWRWMPRDLGKFHILVNVPEFTIRVVDGGAVIHQTRAVVGAPKFPTPTFSHVMDHLVVNPFWNVPTSILSNEMMPEIRRNPSGYFAKRGYQVLARSGGKTRVVDPDSIDWGMINPRTVRIRQVPGDENALGRIKFMFPNQHSVYLHDTPSKALFKKDYRAFSHGCVRVDNPLEFADVLLAAAAPAWTAARIESLYGGPERRIDLDTPIPVHLSYFTRAVDATGRLSRFEDIYGYDEKMQAIAGF